MNYSNLLRGLLDEAKAFKQYKRLPVFVRVLAVIGVLPFILSAFAYILLYTVHGFVFNILASGVVYLEEWLHREKKDVKHATEAVLYFVCMPTIFLTHVILSLLASVYFLVWFGLQCMLYIATLGGIRFQPYINHASYEKSEESEYRMASSKGGLVTVSILSFVLFVLYFIALLSEAEPIAVFNLLYMLLCAIGFPLCAKKEFQEELVQKFELIEDDESDELELPEV